MTAQRDPERLIKTFLEEGIDELPDRAFEAVRAATEQTRQRVVIGPWREPDMNRWILGTAAAALVVVAVIAGYLIPRPTDNVGGGRNATPSPAMIASGEVTFPLGSATMTVSITASGDASGVAGQAHVTHNATELVLDLECLLELDDQTWMFGGEITESNDAGQPAGGRAAVAIRDGSPQQVAVWIEDQPPAATCDELLADVPVDAIKSSLANVEQGELELTVP